VASGADPDEVIEDLRRRLEEELAGREPGSVGIAELRGLLARFGPVGDEPAASAPSGADPASAARVVGPPPPARAKRPWLGRAGIVFCGILLPLAAVGVELLMGLSEPILDPLPTPWHVIACLLVPLANALALRAVVRGEVPGARLVAGNGAALGVAAFYALLYLPLMPVSAIAILVMGVGLLGLSPFLSLLATNTLRRQLRGAALDAG
jgi:hypothetical protein